MTSPNSPITGATAAPPSRRLEPTLPPPPPPRPTRELSEEEFLEREAEDAKAALRQSWKDLKHSLRDASDLRNWARRYPLPTLGAAVATGFVAGLAIGRPDHESRAQREAKTRAQRAKRSRFVRQTLASLAAAAASNVGALLRDSRA